MKNSKNSVMEAVKTKVSKRRRGEPFSAVELGEIGSRAAVHQALSRLARAKKIERVARGIFVKPRVSPILGNLAVPAAKIVEAAVRVSKSRLELSGAEAANRLGLSTQVAAKTVYLTDGPSRTIHIGQQEVELRHRSAKSLIGIGSEAGHVIQALRHLGKQAITSKSVEQLKKTLPNKSKEELLKLIRQAPFWMTPWLRQICND